jgi:hypothetical protein
MDEKDEKEAKNGFPKPADPMGRGVVWCGGGLRGLLNRIFLRPGRIWLQSKVERAQEGTMPGIPTSFRLWQKPPGRLNEGNSPPKWPNSPQKGSLGALIHPKMVQNVEISKWSDFGR